MKTIHPTEWQKMDKRVRTTFFNLLSGFKSPVLIGTISKSGSTNLALFSSLVHIGANPPLLGFILRPTTVARHTYQNIMDTGSYTINHITESLFQKGHQASAKYPEDVSEFEEIGLDSEYTSFGPAPYLKESPIRLGLRFVEEHIIQANGTRLMVGEVMEIQYPEEMVVEEGWFDPTSLGLVGVAGLETYFTLHYLDRLPYARP